MNIDYLGNGLVKCGAGEEGDTGNVIRSIIIIVVVLHVDDVPFSFLRTIRG